VTPQHTDVHQPPVTEADPPVVVVFRVSRGNPRDVFALFPAIEWSPGTVTCYARVGQHSAADYAACIRSSRPARPEQYASLKAELEASPYRYRLAVRRRRPPAGRQP